MELNKIFGKKPNQAPLNQHLGSMAYKDGDDLKLEKLTVTGEAVIPYVGTDEVQSDTIQNMITKILVLQGVIPTAAPSIDLEF